MIAVKGDLTLDIFSGAERPLWSTSHNKKPTTGVSVSSRGKTLKLELGTAAAKQIHAFSDCGRRGYFVVLGSFPGCDVTLELLFALHDSRDELLVEARQVSGEDTVMGIEHLYCFEKAIGESGYLIIPQGSGYLLPADCGDELDIEGIVGCRYSLPLFCMVKSGNALSLIVQTFWDCSVGVKHVPGERSEIDVGWRPSLGSLRYRRSCIVRWMRDTDHVGIAKDFRSYAQEHGYFKTLAEKETETPSVRRFAAGVEYRWPWWKPGKQEGTFRDIDRIRAMGMPVNLFIPKLPSDGYSYNPPPSAYDSGWQSFLNPFPVPGGWETYAGIIKKAKERGCVIKVMLNATQNFEEQVGYDEHKRLRTEEGESAVFPAMSIYYGREILKMVIDSFHANRLAVDNIYFDSYSAFDGMPEDFSPGHTVSRKDAIDFQRACFRDTVEHGMFCGAELPRFWSVSECSYFMFSDWSQDRLTNVKTEDSSRCVGDPIPLFQLVFHECYNTCFSSGGYSLHAGGYDWWSDRNPRLYELLFCSLPSHNWLPGGRTPIEDWGSDYQNRRWSWIRRLNSYYRSTAYAEMTSHSFLNVERTAQKITFANGVTADLDMGSGKMKVKGVEGFTGEWEQPEILT